MNVDLPVLAPSILAADFSKLGDEIRQCLDTGTRWIHCDIMDGHFVPNISYGAGMVQTVRKIAPDAFLDVHLMIEDPDRYIEDFADAGADLISVHHEVCPHLHRTLQNVRLHGCMAAVAINPATPFELIKPVLPDIDAVVIMSVNPGFGGQVFIESTYEKLRELVALRNDLNLNFLIEIDGGVGLKNISKLSGAGADILVAGSSVFKTDDIPKRINELLKLAKTGSGTFV